MLPHHQPDRVRIAFDDHRLVANAGLILPSTSVYPGVGGEPMPDDIGPGQVSKPVVRPGPARHVPSRALDSGGAQHTPSARGRCCRITRIGTTPALGPLFPGGVETGAYRRCLPDQATS